MYQQKLRSPALSAIKGLGVVLGLVLTVLLISVASDLLRPWLISVLGAHWGGMAGAILFWGLGILLALWTMRRYVLAYTYTLESNMLRISFAYGRYQRPMTEIYFNNILHFDTPESIKSRYPNAPTRHATRPTSLPIYALACRDNGKTTIYHLQPDEKVKEKLREVAKGKR